MIKFFQPWCAQCIRMKPDWDRLSEEAHPSVFIADLNCSDHADLCRDEEVVGYPTIKVYKDGSVDIYRDGRDYDSLRSFVYKNLAQKCDIANKAKTCSPKAVKYISKWETKDRGSLKMEIDRLKTTATKVMTADLQVWLHERILILNQLRANEEL